ncbi:MAG: fatty acid hydroxylase, partial [Bacteroidetes bacterium]|nr:fatty acid hydroxylase [Bacteroidota bacterium]
MPKITTEYQHGEARIFKNPFLERLTKTNPLSNIIVYGLGIAFFTYFAIAYIGLNPLVFVG